MSTKRITKDVAAKLSLPVAPKPVSPAPVVAKPAKSPKLASVALTAKAYKVSAEHNMGWWAIITKGVTAGKGQAASADLVKAGVPHNFINYCVRRGHLSQPAA